jgi:hypothetical protein
VTGAILAHGGWSGVALFAAALAALAALAWLAEHRGNAVPAA